MIIFLTMNKYREAASHLAENLETTSSVITDPSVLRNTEDVKLIVRYGYTGYAGLDTSNHVLNKAEAISLSSNKYGSLIRMRENGIPVVPFATVGQYLNDRNLAEEIGLPLIGRTFSHFGGHDLRYITLTRNLPRNPYRPSLFSDYVLKYIPRTREFRVWTFNTRNHYTNGRGRYICIKAAEKQDKNEIDRSRQRMCKRIIKNRKNGYAFNWLEDFPAEVRDLGKRATECFGLDFAAVDIIQDLDTGNYYVLEVNTAPGTASESTVRLLAERIGLTYNRIMRNGNTNQEGSENS